MTILTRFGFLHPAQDQCPTSEAFRLSAVVCGLDLGLRPVCRFVVNLAELFRGGTLQQAYWSNVRMHFDTAYDDGKLWSMLCGPAPWFPPEACGGAPKYVGQIIALKGVRSPNFQPPSGPIGVPIIGSMAGTEWWDDPQAATEGRPTGTHAWQPEKDTPQGAVDRASSGSGCWWVDGSGKQGWEVPPRPELRDFSIKPSPQFLADAAGLLAETFGSRCEFVAAPVNEPDGPTYDPNIVIDKGEGSDQDSILANARDIAAPYFSAWNAICPDTTRIIADASTDDGLRRYINAFGAGRFAPHFYPWQADFMAGIKARVPGFVKVLEWAGSPDIWCTETDGQPADLASEIQWLRAEYGDRLKMLIFLDATRAIDGYRGGVPKINDGGQIIGRAVAEAAGVSIPPFPPEPPPSAEHRRSAEKE